MSIFNDSSLWKWTRVNELFPLPDDPVNLAVLGSPGATGIPVTPVCICWLAVRLQSCSTHHMETVFLFSWSSDHILQLFLGKDLIIAKLWLKHNLHSTACYLVLVAQWEWYIALCFHRGLWSLFAVSPSNRDCVTMWLTVTITSVVFFWAVSSWHLCLLISKNLGHELYIDSS